MNGSLVSASGRNPGRRISLTVKLSHVNMHSAVTWSAAYKPLQMPVVSRGHHGYTFGVVAHFMRFVIAADVLSAVEFDSTGRFLATGDKGGRIVLFENNGDVRMRTFMCLHHHYYCKMSVLGQKNRWPRNL